MNEGELMTTLCTNLSEAKRRANKWYKDRSIEGAVLVVQYFDTTNAGDDGIDAVYTRQVHVGINSSSAFRHHLLETVSTEHRRKAGKTKDVLSHRSDTVTDRIVVNGENGEVFDVAFAAWGCKTHEQMIELVGILKRNLKKSRQL